MNIFIHRVFISNRRTWKLEQESQIISKGDSIYCSGTQDEVNEISSFDLLSLVSAASADVGDNANVRFLRNCHIRTTIKVTGCWLVVSDL